MTTTDDSVTATARSDFDALTQILDGLPIYATRIGCRMDSTDEDRALMGALFRVHETWNEVKP